ncbi:hypothetical protein PCE1_001768 [Barthelona sp. PCE]
MEEVTGNYDKNMFVLDISGETPKRFITYPVVLPEDGVLDQRLLKYGSDAIVTNAERCYAVSAIMRMTLANFLSAEDITEAVREMSSTKLAEHYRNKMVFEEDSKSEELRQVAVELIVRIHRHRAAQGAFVYSEADENMAYQIGDFLKEQDKSYMSVQGQMGNIMIKIPERDNDYPYAELEHLNKTFGCVTGEAGYDELINYFTDKKVKGMPTEIETLQGIFNSDMVVNPPSSVATIFMLGKLSMFKLTKRLAALVGDNEVLFERLFTSLGGFMNLPKDKTGRCATVAIETSLLSKELLTNPKEERRYNPGPNRNKKQRAKEKLTGAVNGLSRNVNGSTTVKQRYTKRPPKVPPPPGVWNHEGKKILVTYDYIGNGSGRDDPGRSPPERCNDDKTTRDNECVVVLRDKPPPEGDTEISCPPDIKGGAKDPVGETKTRKREPGKRSGARKQRNKRTISPKKTSKADDSKVEAKEPAGTSIDANNGSGKKLLSLTGVVGPREDNQLEYLLACIEDLQQTQRQIDKKIPDPPKAKEVWDEHTKREKQEKREDDKCKKLDTIIESNKAILEQLSKRPTDESVETTTECDLSEKSLKKVINAVRSNENITCSESRDTLEVQLPEHREKKSIHGYKMNVEKPHSTLSYREKLIESTVRHIIEGKTQMHFELYTHARRVRLSGNNRFGQFDIRTFTDEKKWAIRSSDHFLESAPQLQKLRDMIGALEFADPDVVYDRVIDTSPNRWLDAEMVEYLKHNRKLEGSKVFDPEVAEEAFATVAPFVERVPDDKRDDIIVVNDVFAIPKDNGKWRVIMDAPEAHDASIMLPVALPGERIAKLIPRDAYMASIDLSSWFYHNMMDEATSMFFVFKHQDEYYRFTRTPFGSSIAGNISNSVSSMIAALVNQCGSCCEVYVDDFIIYGKDYEVVRRTVHAIQYLCFILGIQINMDKSVLTPTKRINWLGYHFDTYSGNATKVRIADDKCRGMIKVVQEHIQHLIKFEGSISLEDAMSLAGKLESKSFACPKLKRYAERIQEIIRDTVRISIRAPIEQECIPCYRKKHLQNTLIPQKLCPEYLQIMREALESLTRNANREIDVRAEDVIIMSDACLNGHREGHGGFTSRNGEFLNELKEAALEPGTLLRELELDPDESESYMIMHAEIQALHTIVKTAAPLNPNSDFLIGNDNTAVVYGLRTGRSRNMVLDQCIKSILALFEKYNIRMNLMYVQSKINIAADYLSRGVATTNDHKMYQIRMMQPAKKVRIRKSVPRTLDVPVAHRPFKKRPDQSSKGKSKLMFHTAMLYGASDPNGETLPLPDYNQSLDAFTLTSLPEFLKEDDIIDITAPNTAFTFEGDRVDIPAMSKIECAAQDLPSTYFNVEHNYKKWVCNALDVPADQALEILCTKAIRRNVKITVIAPYRIPFTSMWSRCSTSPIQDNMGSYTGYKIIIDPQELGYKPLQKKSHDAPGKIAVPFGGHLKDQLTKMYSKSTVNSMMKTFKKIHTHLITTQDASMFNEKLNDVCCDLKLWNDWFCEQYLTDTDDGVSDLMKGTHQSYYSRLLSLHKTFLYVYHHHKTSTNDKKWVVGRVIQQYHATHDSADRTFRMAATAEVIKRVIQHAIATKKEIIQASLDNAEFHFKELLTMLAFVAIAYLAAGRQSDFTHTRLDEIAVSGEMLTIVFRRTKTQFENKMWLVPIEDIQGTPGLDWLVAYLYWMEQATDHLEDRGTLFNTKSRITETSEKHHPDHPGIKQELVIASLQGCMTEVQSKLESTGLIPENSDTYARLTPHSLRSGFIVDANFNVDDSSIHGRWSTKATTAHQYYMSNIKPRMDQAQSIDSLELEYGSFYEWIFGLPHTDLGDPFVAPYPNLDLCKSSKFQALLPLHIREGTMVNHATDPQDPRLMNN